MIIDQESLFESSMIQKCLYNFTTNTLKVKFKSGQLYEYLDVEASVYDSMCTAESTGKFFMEHIKNKYEYSQLIID